MTAQLTLVLDKTVYTKGDTITATYKLTGADDVPAQTVPVPVAGSSVVDGQPISASGTINVTTPAVTHTRAFAAPTVAGVKLTATADPTVWTGTA